jgi:hypothetical protein
MGGFNQWRKTMERRPRRVDYPKSPSDRCGKALAWLIVAVARDVRPAGELLGLFLPHPIGSKKDSLKNVILDFMEEKGFAPKTRLSVVEETTARQDVRNSLEDGRFFVGLLVNAFREQLELEGFQVSPSWRKRRDLLNVPQVVRIIQKGIEVLPYGLLLEEIDKQVGRFYCRHRSKAPCEVTTTRLKEPENILYILDRIPAEPDVSLEEIERYEMLAATYAETARESVSRMQTEGTFKALTEAFDQEELERLLTQATKGVLTRNGTRRGEIMESLFPQLLSPPGKSRLGGIGRENGNGPVKVGLQFSSLLDVVRANPLFWEYFDGDDLDELLGMVTYRGGTHEE